MLRVTDLDLAYFDKFVKENEYTTYRLILHIYDADEPFFLYFIITQDALGEKAGFAKYLPEADTGQIDPLTFTGKIQLLDIEEGLKGETVFLNGQAQRFGLVLTTECTEQLSLIIHTCTHGGEHLPGESCNYGNVNDGYYEIKVSKVCRDAYVNTYIEEPEHFVDLAPGSPGGIADPCSPNVFIGSLNGIQQFWWNDPHNVVKVAQIKAFRSSNPCSPNNDLQAKAIIDAFMEGSAIDFENKIILDPSFKNNQKAFCVYDKMKSNNGFKTFTAPFNIENPVAFIKLKAGQVLDNDRAMTSPPDENNIIVITINNNPTHPNGINSQPNLFLCQTIIHEVIHAEFFRRIIEALGSNPASETLQTIIDALKKSKYQVLANYLLASNQWPDWPHNYMAEQFRKSIARVTQEFDTGNPVTEYPQDILHVLCMERIRSNRCCGVDLFTESNAIGHTKCIYQLY